MKRLVSWREYDDPKRKEAIIYIDGQIYTGHSHSSALNQYIKDHNIDRLNDYLQPILAYLNTNGNIYILRDWAGSTDSNLLNQAVIKIKEKYPSSKVFLDDLNNYGNDYDPEDGQIACNSRLRKIAEGEDYINDGFHEGDSFNVMYTQPMGIIFKDFDQKVVDKDKITKQQYGPSNQIHWDFEKPIDNPEWLLRSEM